MQYADSPCLLPVLDSLYASLLQRIQHWNRFHWHVTLFNCWKHTVPVLFHQGSAARLLSGFSAAGQEKCSGRGLSSWFTVSKLRINTLRFTLTLSMNSKLAPASSSANQHAEWWWAPTCFSSLTSRFPQLRRTRPSRRQNNAWLL